MSKMQCLVLKRGVRIPSHRSASCGTCLLKTNESKRNVSLDCVGKAMRYVLKCRRHSQSSTALSSPLLPTQKAKTNKVRRVVYEHKSVGDGRRRSKLANSPLLCEHRRTRQKGRLEVVAGVAQFWKYEEGSSALKYYSGRWRTSRSLRKQGISRANVSIVGGKCKRHGLQSVARKRTVLHRL